MSRREAVVVVALAIAAVTVAFGAGLVYRPAGVIAAGIFAACLTLFVLVLTQPE